MLDKRMPLMINENYEPATASMRIFLKDIDVISKFLKDNNLISPTFDVLTICIINLKRIFQ